LAGAAVAWGIAAGKRVVPRKDQKKGKEKVVINETERK